MSTEHRPTRAEDDPDVAVDLTLWGRAWPSLLAVTVVGAVGAPAAVASYMHARDVVAYVGNEVMAPWLPLSVDGMLLASLVVIWVRRHRNDKIGAGPWFAFGFGMVVTILANLAAVQLPADAASLYAMTGHHIPVREVGYTDYVVALFPPLALAITLELVGMVANRTSPEKRRQLAGDRQDHQAASAGDHQRVATSDRQTTSAGDRQVTQVVVTGRPAGDRQAASADRQIASPNRQAVAARITSPPAPDRQVATARITSPPATSPSGDHQPAGAGDRQAPAPTASRQLAVRPADQSTRALSAVPAPRPSWMTDEVLQRVLTSMAKAHAEGKPYGRPRVIEDHGLNDHQAKTVLRFVNDHNLMRRSA